MDHGLALDRKRHLRILDRLFGPTSDRLELALGRAAKRQHVLASNLANISTPGYKRRDFDFTVALDEVGSPKLGPAAEPQQALWSEVVPAEVTSFENGPKVARENRSIRLDGNGVDLEREVAALTETHLHFGALSLMSQRYFQGLKDVIKEGR
ncbi:MAG: flagellar basal body rod protein FlgB [Armatimonadetes bacterium]|nr:flagellar basal body rod protein FlgB [Armatimonadota bacterium]